MSSIVKRSGKWIFLGVVFIVLAPSVSAEGVRRDLTEKVASGESTRRGLRGGASIPQTQPNVFSLRLIQEQREL